MKTSVRSAALCLSVCSAALLASCGDKANTQTNTCTTPDGLKVTAAVVPPDDTAQLMDMRFWKFGVEVPKPGQGLNCRLEVRRNGKTLETIGIGTSPMPGDRSTRVEAEVGLYPLGGDLTMPGKLKTLCKMNGGSSSISSDNPFSGSSGFATGEPLPTPDGGLMLLTAGKTASWPPADDGMVLVCKFRVTPPIPQQ